MKRRTLRGIKYASLVLLGAFALVQILGVFNFNRNEIRLVDTKAVKPGESIEAVKLIFKENGIKALPPPVIKKNSSLPNVQQQQQHEHEQQPPPVLSSQVIKNLNPNSAESNSDIAGLKPLSSLSGERSHNLPVVNNETSFKSKNDNEIAAAAADGNPGIDIAKILGSIDEINTQQFIRNEEIFGPVNNNTVVITIQVHNRLHYLRQLIVSLSTARDIEKTLLIFSHDLWDPEINKLISSVDFAKSMQIFYPFSIQTHPNEFPGESPNDCPRNSKKIEVENMNCTNRDWPDLYGHYREAKFTQTKHHWWWKANRIFDQLRATKNFNGLVVFLEEDHHVAEDFLHVLKLVDISRRSHHSDCDIISLGTYLKNLNFPKQNKAVLVTQWVSSKHNMGMAFDRKLWQKFHNLTSDFCTFDDYNWDWALHHLSHVKFKKPMQVMMVSAPRVFHVGECGVHHKKKDCESSLVVKKVQEILKQASPYLFPKDLIITKAPVSKKKKKTPKGNGGWGDLRDQVLCQNMALPMGPKGDMKKALAVAQSVPGIKKKWSKMKTE